MTLVIVLILLTFGSILFHFLSPWWFTPLASNWGMIDDALIITFWICGIVFLAINLFMIYAVIRFRYKKERRAHYEPENAKLERNLTLVTTVGIVIMLAPGLYAWHEYITVPEDAAIVEAVGQQWQWTFRFPGEDGVLGIVETAYISLDNPFGLNPNDPAGRDDILIESSELHLPVDQPVKLLLRAKDVLHNFYVPQFRAKMDLVPGLVTYIWFIPTKTGTYEIVCAELCGIGHYTMRGTVVVDEQADFEAWLSERPTFAPAAVADAG